MEKHDPDAIYPNTIKYTDKEREKIIKEIQSNRCPT